VGLTVFDIHFLIYGSRYIWIFSVVDIFSAVAWLATIFASEISMIDYSEEKASAFRPAIEPL
jgi:hypothetical protein